MQKKFEYANEDYMVVVPASAFDIKDEGAKQNHCVGSYLQAHAKGDKTILFLRKVSAPFIPFYTIEYSGNRVRQCRGYKNLDSSEEERKRVDIFVEEWLKNKVNKKSKKSKKKAVA